MAQMNLDLPQDTLDDISRLAQEFNVHRVDVVIRAVASYGEALKLEERLRGLEDRLAAAERLKLSLSRQLQARRTGGISLRRDLEEARSQAGLALRDKVELIRRLREARLAAARDREALAAAAERRDAAIVHANLLEERDRKKTLEVMRHAEVVKLRRFSQELSVKVERIERDLTYKSMDADRKGKRLDQVTRQLASTLKQRRALEDKLGRLTKDAHASERQIGGLMRERGRLREELKKLARLLKAERATPAKPKETRKKSS